MANIFIKYFVLITELIKYRKKVSENNNKKLKKKQDNLSDFKLESAKMLLIEFFQHSSNFRRKFRLVLEYVTRESDKNTPAPSLLSLKTKD